MWLVTPGPPDAAVALGIFSKNVNPLIVCPLMGVLARTSSKWTIVLAFTAGGVSAASGTTNRAAWATQAAAWTSRAAKVVRRNERVSFMKWMPRTRWRQRSV